MDAQLWCQMQPYHGTMPCVSSLSRPRMIPLQRSSTGCPRQCHGLKILETLDGKCYGTVDSNQPKRSQKYTKGLDSWNLLEPLFFLVCDKLWCHKTNTLHLMRIVSDEADGLFMTKSDVLCLDIGMKLEQMWPRLRSKGCCKGETHQHETVDGRQS